MKILKNILLLGFSLLIANFAYKYFANLLFSVFPLEGGGSWIDTTALSKLIMGAPIAYLFFLFLFFTAFGDVKKYWWIGIASIPALLFLLGFDPYHLYFTLLFPLAGWLIGWGIAKVMRKAL